MCNNINLVLYSVFQYCLNIRFSLAFIFISDNKIFSKIIILFYLKLYLYHYLNFVEIYIHYYTKVHFYLTQTYRIFLFHYPAY